MVEYQHVRNGDGARGRNDASPWNQCDAGFQPSGLTNGSLPSPAGDDSNLLGDGPDEITEMAARLTKAQREALIEVCRTNGGGVRVRCRVGEDGYGIPTNRAFARLQEIGLIQGKSGSYETVVHSPLGLAVRRHLQAGGA